MFVEALIYIALFWAAVCFFDIIFKSCMLYPYLLLLEKGGLTVKPGQIQWYTTRWNRTIQKWGMWRPRFLRKWFALGAAISSLSVVPSMCLLIITVKNMLFATSALELQQQALQPAIPGINLPLSDIPYYLVTLLICSVFHEFGHALAAVRGDVKIQGCGLFVFGVFPGAFVDLPTEQVTYLSPWWQLHVFCAGVWHNIVLAIVAACLFFLNPVLLAPLYQPGLSVISVTENSGVAGPAGLIPGEHVKSINSCTVTDESSWKACIISAAVNQQPGYCTSWQFLFQENTVIDGNLQKFKMPFDCCDITSKSNLCFDYKSKEGEKRYACLPVRKMLQETNAICNTSKNCGHESWTCVKPVLDSNITRLVEINVAGGKKVLFVGNPLELYYSVSVTRWVARFHLIPAKLVYIYETLLKYLVSFSAALAVLNIIPCPALDGQWITQALVELLFIRLLPYQPHRKLLLLGLIVVGSLLIVATLCLGLWTLFINSG